VLDENIPLLIRYQASFTAGASTFKAGDLSQHEMRSDKSCDSASVAFLYEYFPLSIAAFACGQPPACPDLSISIELEHLGYAYDLP
jgi:hypothetical protein